MNIELLDGIKATFLGINFSDETDKISRVLSEIVFHGHFILDYFSGIIALQKSVLGHEATVLKINLTVKM